ncbi:hypothetical protein [Parerythrobacter lacustris]|uniref:Uncharacterized protein n=1 Tax=Parerythrobacter lacustris TaxID=2969984 RepID=A0ABT1XQF3_9SPHN|nr:hypothetical protein [Parerythrobacter lacustris]MCR2833876.1 hypothetical protein [Parerythrobacter lacustris]
MPERQEDDDGEVWGGDRRLSRPDTSLPDWEMPDGAYRPVPIVWFSGALFLQILVQPLIALIVIGILGLPGRTNLAIAFFATGMIAQMTWNRGMAQAPAVWQVLTGAMLAGSLALIALAHIPEL